MHVNATHAIEAKSKEQINVTLKASLLLCHAPKANFSMAIFAKTNLISSYRFAGRIFLVRLLWTSTCFQLIYPWYINLEGALSGKLR